MRAPDGHHWELFDDDARVVSVTNPRFALGPADLDMVSLYFAFKRGDLPERGTILDQSAAMIAAFRLMAEAEAWVEDNIPRRDGE